MGKEKVILEVEAKTGKADKSLEKVKKTTKETGTAAKDAAQQFTFMGVSIGGLKNSFAKIIPVAKSMFSTIKMGIASTGIGLLVIAIGALVSNFTATKKGAEQLQVAFKAVGATIDVLRDRVSKIGGAIIKVFKGDFTGAAKDAKSAVTGLGEEIRKETQAMIELTQTLQRVRDAERDFSKERAQTNQEIAKARMLAEDETASYEERISALQRANELEITTTEKAIKLMEEKLEAKRTEVNLGESLAEDLDELAALEVELINMQTQSFSTRKRLMTGEETLRREFEAQKRADAKEEADRIKALAKEKEDREKEQEKIRQDADEARAAYEQEQREAREKADEEERLRAEALAAAKMDMAKGTLDGIKGIFGEESAAGKAAAIAQATINTYEGISAAIAAGPPPLNFALAAVTGAAGFQNIAKIMGVGTPKFNRGGVVGGMGTGTSDSINARLSKGESVINARSTRMFKPILSAMNEAGGGRSFAAGDGTSGMTLGAVKAFVVADDMSKQQDKLTKIRRKATI